MRRAIISLALLVGFGLAMAQSPKREMRAVWTATVYQLDWPSSVITTTGSIIQINAQKNLMIRLLDSLVAANMNAIYFQVRSRCDAMYKSSYEPWSTDLVATRGMDPGYDPLQFVINEAHKRGLEVHAWLNPYRFETTLNAWSGQAGDYRSTNPDWVLTYSSGYSILDPGQPGVLKRIRDIVAEIVNNYDVDGIVFDDYFYNYGGTPSTLDVATQIAYKPMNMSIDDWRRKNVNDMIAAVYDTIQKTKPYVTFGVSPFGIWTTNSSVAAANGLTLPAGITGLNAYQDIYCDPVAWLTQGTVDYVSPQLYWPTTQVGQQYGILCPWWSDVAYRFGKHLYSSQTLSGISYSGAHGLQGADDIGLQIDINRTSTKNNAPGSVLYSAKTLYNVGMFAQFLKTRFINRALVPAIDWKEHPVYGAVEGLTQTGTQLSWNNIPGVRYSVYAVPLSQASQPDNFSTSRYLLGVSYTNSYTVPAALASGDYYFGVAVYDRYANEYTVTTTSPPTGLQPVNSDAFDCIAYRDAAGISYLKITCKSRITVVSASLVNMLGSVQSDLITNKTIPAGEYLMPLPAGLPKGVYIIRVNSTAGNRQIKIIL